MNHKHEVTIRRTFDYLKIANDNMLPLMSLNNEHLDNAKVKITEAIEELGLGYSEIKSKKWNRELMKYE